MSMVFFLLNIFKAAFFSLRKKWGISNQEFELATQKLMEEDYKFQGWRLFRVSSRLANLARQCLKTQSRKRVRALAPWESVIDVLDSKFSLWSRKDFFHSFLGKHACFLSCVALATVPGIKPHHLGQHTRLSRCEGWWNLKARLGLEGGSITENTVTNCKSIMTVALTPSPVSIIVSAVIHRGSTDTIFL